MDVARGGSYFVMDEATGAAAFRFEQEANA